MRIAIIRVPTVIDASASTAPVCPPIGLAYLNAVAHQFTRDIQIIDTVGNNPKITNVFWENQKWKLLGETAEECALHLKPETDVVLVSVMFSQDWPYAQAVLSQVRSRCPKAIIIVGGEHVTAVPEFCLSSSPEADLAVLGEGEHVLAEVLSRLQLSSDVPRDVAGTCLRDLDRTIRVNPRSERIPIAAIPLPNWEGFPLENYLSGGHGFGVNLGRSMPIMATRGCPYRCTFCSSPLMWTTSWKAREPEEVLAEMKSYIYKYQATNFDFYDLTAIIRKDWIVRFSRMLIQEDLKITWQLPSGTRSEAIDREVARLLYSSGCRNISYAPESGSREMLRLIKKQISLPNMIQSMRACVSEGLSVKMNIICGFPRETQKHLWQSFKFILKTAWIGIDDMSINQFSPYPGCELFNELVKENQLVLDDKYFESLSYYSSMTHARSYSRNLTSSEILVFKHLGMVAFYFVSFCRRPWRIFRTLLNGVKGTETTRMEKALYAYLRRYRPMPSKLTA